MTCAMVKGLQWIGCSGSYHDPHLVDKVNELDLPQLSTSRRASKRCVVVRLHERAHGSGNAPGAWGHLGVQDSMGKTVVCGAGPRKVREWQTGQVISGVKLQKSLNFWPVARNSRKNSFLFVKIQQNYQNTCCTTVHVLPPRSLN